MTRPSASFDSPGRDEEQAIFRDLLVRIAQRDERALATFYDATSGRVYALALRITREPPTAEEVAADVYLQVWQQAQRYDPQRGRASTWLLTLCRSRAIDHLRRRGRADAYADPTALRPDLYVEAHEPADFLSTVQDGTRVHAALAELGETERRLLALAFFEGLSHSEIAAQTGIPLGSAKTILRRAMQTMRRHLEIIATDAEEVT